MQITRNSLDTNPGPADWFTPARCTSILSQPRPSHPECRGVAVTWGEHVTDGQYGVAPAS